MNSTRQTIIHAIEQNLSGKEYSYPILPVFPQSEQPLLHEFKENLLVGAGRWYAVENEQEALDLIGKLHPQAKVICSATPEIKGNKKLEAVLDPHDLNEVDVGVFRACFGVSETGMIWVTENELGMNALGFLSQHLIVLLDPAQLVRDLHEAYARIDLDKIHYGCFMLGPSATADIGAYMVRGAQGARSLTVLFKTNPFHFDR